MKKIILLLTLLVVASSCLRREDPHGYKTAFGASIIYEGTSMAIAYSEFVLMAVEMDIVATAPTEKRDSLEKALFPYAKFRTSENVYSLTRDNTLYFEVITDGKTLTTPGAKWVVTYYRPNTGIKDYNLITCMHSNSWQLNISKTEQAAVVAFNLQLTSEREAIDATPRKTKFSLALNNSTLLEPSRHLMHKLNTASPIVISSKNFSDRYGSLDDHINNASTNVYRYEILGGDISDTFVNQTKNLMEEVNAVFIRSSSESSFRNAKITYSGIAEEWYWHDILYYNNRYYD